VCVVGLDLVDSLAVVLFYIFCITIFNLVVIFACLNLNTLELCSNEIS
jgi:hypothetical protein